MAIFKRVKRLNRMTKGLNATSAYHPISILFHKRDKVDGMNKVVWNLQRGLAMLGIECIDNKITRFTGCLQGGVPLYDSLPVNTLMGVSLMEIPKDQPHIWKRYNRFVTCSDWVKKKYETFTETQGKKISVWASGVDTERFISKGKNYKYDAFIYYKDITKQVNQTDLINLEKYLLSKRIKYNVIRYGQYQENDLINACHDCRYGIMLTGTESQGIALLEILSMETPLYIIDVTQYRHRKTGFTFNGASSAPFFDDRCGIKHKDISRLEEFINNLENYKPRDYVLENFTLEKCAMRYYNILTGIEQ